MAGRAAVAALLIVLAAQSLLQVRDLRAAEYAGLKDWVVTHVRDRPFYILGYDALILPKNTQCLERTREVLTRLVERDRAGMPFAARHVKSWEERAALVLQDMLDVQHEPGYEFYDFHSAPPEVLGAVVDLDRMPFLIVQDGFALDEVPRIRDRLQSAYELVAETHGAGGGGRGLKYRIYRQR